MIHEKTFKERLKILIGERGHEIFVRRTGISETSLRHYLSGASLPTLKILEKISAANGVSIGWLIGEEPHPQLANQIREQLPNSSMQEISQWISIQRDGINYWEVLKANLAREYPEFRDWLRENNH